MALRTYNGSVLTVAHVPFPPLETPCFQRERSLLRPAEHCTVPGIQIEILMFMQRHLSAHRFSLVQVDEIGSVVGNASRVPGLIGDIQTGAVDFMPTSITLNYRRYQGLHYFYESPFEGYMCLVVNPLNITTIVNPFDVFPSAFWVMFIVSHMVIIATIFLTNNDTSLRSLSLGSAFKFYADSTFRLSFGQRNRTYWPTAKHMIIVTSWCLMTRIILTMFKTEFVGHFSERQKFPKKVGDLEEFQQTHGYHLVLEKDTYFTEAVMQSNHTTFKDLRNQLIGYNLTRPSQIKPPHDALQRVIGEPGAIMNAHRLQARYAQQTHEYLIVNCYEALEAYYYTVAHRNLPSEILGRIRNVTIMLVENGIHKGITNRYGVDRVALSIETAPTLTVQSFVNPSVIYLVGVTGSLIGFVMEILMAKLSAHLH